MNLTEAQKAEFDRLALDLIEWLGKNCHPHVHVVIDSQRAEASEGFRCVVLKEGES